MDELNNDKFGSEKINNVKGYSNSYESILSPLSFISLAILILSLAMYFLTGFIIGLFLKMAAISLVLMIVSIILTGAAKSSEKEKHYYISCNNSIIMIADSADGYYKKASEYRSADFGTYTKKLTIHSKEKCGLGCRHINFYDKNSDTVRIKTYLEKYGIAVDEYNDTPDTSD